MLERVHLVVLAAAALVVLGRRSPRVGAVAALAATLSAVPVLLVPRALLVPALLGPLALWLDARGRRAPRGAWPAAWSTLALGLALLGAVGHWLVPPARLVPPTGPWAVGIRDWVVVDSSRAEPLTSDPNDRRVMAVRAWYPVAPAPKGREVRAEYLPHARRVYRGIAESLGVPALVVSGVDHLRGSGRTGATPAGAGPWPLILYSGGFRQGHHVHNTELAEELASRGYLVVGVGHSWEQAVTYRDDGSLLTLDDPGVQTAVSRIAAERGPGPVPTSQELGLLSPGARGERIAAYLAGVPNHQFSASLWRADLDAVLDRVLEGRGEVGRFLQPLANPDRLGVMGMSFGGSTAGQLCANEPRCLAGANLDGTQWGEWFGEGFKTPFLYMSQELDTWNDAWYGGAGLDYHRVRVAGAFHGDFTDGFHSTPLTRWAGVLGPIGGRRSGEILRAYVTAFFDRYLKNEPAPLLEGPAPFPEVSHRRGSTSGERHDSEVEEGVLSEPSAPSPPVVARVR